VIRVGLCLIALALCVPRATPCAGLVDVDKVIANAQIQAGHALDTTRCEGAFQIHMPGYDDEWRLRATFQTQVNFHRVPGYILSNPFAWGAVDCDNSANTFLISDAWAGLVGTEKMKQTFLHEFVHLLRCDAIIHDCGRQSNCSPSRHVYEEKLAYTIAQICSND